MERRRDLAVVLFAVFAYAVIGMLSGVIFGTDSRAYKDISKLIKEHPYAESGLQYFSSIFDPAYCYADDDDADDDADDDDADDDDADDDDADDDDADDDDAADDDDKKGKKGKKGEDDDDSTDGVGDPEQGAHIPVDVELDREWKEVE